MTFGEKFKAEREKRKLTQQEVADALGINRRMITRYENGISFPRTKDAYRKIAEYFKVDVNYLLTEDEEFVVQASEQYGSRGMKQAKDLIEGMSGLFADDVDGPWEWKGPAARSGKCLYGKLFNKKAGFVSREWIPDFANFRRDGYDFDARWDDGLASYKDKEIYEAITGEGRMLSKRLKEALNYRKGGNTGFETCITRLQMQSYVCIADFVYMQDRYGRPYGWGVAEYATPEELFGYDFITSGYQRDPQESKERMMQHLSSILPGASVQQLTKILKG